MPINHLISRLISLHCQRTGRQRSRRPLRRIWLQVACRSCPTPSLSGWLCRQLTPSQLRGMFRLPNPALCRLNRQLWGQIVRSRRILPMGRTCALHCRWRLAASFRLSLRLRPNHPPRFGTCQGQTGKTPHLPVPQRWQTWQRRQRFRLGQARQVLPQWWIGRPLPVPRRPATVRPNLRALRQSRVKAWFCPSGQSRPLPQWPLPQPSPSSGSRLQINLFPKLRPSPFARWRMCRRAAQRVRQSHSPMPPGRLCPRTLAAHWLWPRGKRLPFPWAGRSSLPVTCLRLRSLRPFPSETRSTGPQIRRSGKYRLWMPRAPLPTTLPSRACLTFRPLWQS